MFCRFRPAPDESGGILAPPLGRDGGAEQEKEETVCDHINGSLMDGMIGLAAALGGAEDQADARKRAAVAVVFFVCFCYYAFVRRKNENELAASMSR